MRAHIIKDGVIANSIETEDLDVIPGLVAAVGEEQIGWLYDGSTFSPPPVVIEVPVSVSPRQIRQALTATGLRARVEAAVAAGSQDLKDWWEFATAFERYHPMVIAMAAALGITDQQLDDLFVLAGSL